jgi:putative Mg2+ transporter-C (MgtC) family protein
MGSALYLELGAYAFHHDVDPTRVAAQIVTGVGFLGAGVIMKQGLSVTGLNTAATLWSTAAVGALAGAGAFREAIVGAGIIVAANSLLHPLAQRMDALHLISREGPPIDYVLDVVCQADAEQPVRSLIVQVIEAARMRLDSIESGSAGSEDKVRLRTKASAARRDDSQLRKGVAALCAEPRVVSVRWTASGEGAVVTPGADVD